MKLFPSLFQYNHSYFSFEEVNTSEPLSDKSVDNIIIIIIAKLKSLIRNYNCQLSDVFHFSFNFFEDASSGISKLSPFLLISQVKVDDFSS